jgi:hypothetical protein
LTGKFHFGNFDRSCKDCFNEQWVRGHFKAGEWARHPPANVSLVMAKEKNAKTAGHPILWPEGLFACFF